MAMAAVRLGAGGPTRGSGDIDGRIQEVCGAGRVGEGPKVCSAAALLSGSLQEAIGSASAPTDIASSMILRMMAPCLPPDNALLIVRQRGKATNVRGVCYEFGVN